MVSNTPRRQRQPALAVQLPSWHTMGASTQPIVRRANEPQFGVPRRGYSARDPKPGVPDHQAIQHSATGVTVCICSSGGDVTSGVGAYNFMRMQPVPVRTYAFGVCSSVAATMFMAGIDRISAVVNSFHSTLRATQKDRTLVKLLTAHRLSAHHFARCQNGTNR